MATFFSDRLFEIPYNFDLGLLNGIQLLHVPIDNIYCFYIPPYQEDYTSIFRGSTFLARNRKEYEVHISYIKELFGANKLQLLLQSTNTNKILPKEKLIYYFRLGFTKFCCGSIEQAKMIKEINSEAEIVGSITMKINQQKIQENFLIYKKIFDKFVLDFSYTRDIEKIKKMPTDFQYLLLVNSPCNSQCDGTHHWFAEDQYHITCPGKHSDISFEQSCIINPIDLCLFDKYISIYKLQDRGWPTDIILRDLIVYSRDYKLYPNIKNDFEIYYKK